MIRGDLKEGMLFYAGRHETNRYSSGDWLRLGTLMNERLGLFTELTRCLFSDKVPMTLTATEPVYSIVDTDVFDEMFVEVTDITINGTALLDTEGYRGPSSLNAIVERYPDWQTRDDALPQFWWREDPESIRLFPAPDAVYSNNFAAGFLRHSEFAAETTFADHEANDLLTVQVPRGLEDVCKKFCAIGLVDPVSNKERYRELEADTAGPMAAWRKKAEGRPAGMVVVGRRQGGLSRRMGR